MSGIVARVREAITTYEVWADSEGRSGRTLWFIANRLTRECAGPWHDYEDAKVRCECQNAALGIEAVRKFDRLTS